MVRHCFVYDSSCAGVFNRSCHSDRLAIASLCRVNGYQVHHVFVDTLLCRHLRLALCSGLERTHDGAVRFPQAYVQGDNGERSRLLAY